MTDEQMIKEIIERRRQWGETRGSDFDWIMNHIEKQQKEIEYLQKSNEQLNFILGKSDTKLIKMRQILEGCM